MTDIAQTIPTNQELAEQNAELERLITAMPAQLANWREQLAFNRGLLTMAEYLANDLVDQTTPGESDASH